MFKRCLAVLLILTLTAASFQRFFVYAGFKLNQDYISKNLCVNRNRPWMHCNGKCYFMRKIKAAQENEKKQADKDNFSRLEVSFFQHARVIDLSSPLTATLPAGELPVYSCLYNFSFSTFLLQPPRLNA
ncbi:MAG TPA: hypothetical protein VHA56_19955 [Mucilaginibacter sp.]|nr:hypothetical protein [Mucilaginibacter sp.]